MSSFADLTPLGAPTDADSLLGVNAARTGGRYVASSLAAYIAATAKAYQAGGAGAVARSLQDKARESVSALDYGVKADDATDDTAALQRAVTALGTAGGIVRIPATGKPIRLAGTVNVAAPVIFVGQGMQPFSTNRSAGGIVTPSGGSWFRHDNLSGPAFYISGYDASGAGFRDVAFCETHPTPGAGWTPTAYPPCVQVDTNAKDINFLGRVHFHGVNKGVLMDYCDRPVIDTLTGQFFAYGLSIDHCYDIGTVNTFRAWAYWSENANVLAYTQANTRGMILGTPDAAKFSKVFGICLKELIYIPTGDGISHTLWVDQLYADFTGTAVNCVAPTIYAHLDQVFHLGQAWGASTALTGAAAFKISGNGCNWLVNALRSTLSWQSSVILSGTTTIVQFGSLACNNYNQANDGSAMLNAGADSNNSIHVSHDPWWAGDNGGGLYSYGASVNSRCYSPLMQVHGGTTKPTNFARVNSGGPGAGVSIYGYGETNIPFTVQGIGSGQATLASQSGKVALQSGSAVGLSWDGTQLAISNLPASATPAANKDLTFQLTSNTSLTLKVKGSDGVVRSTALTLA